MSLMLVAPSAIAAAIETSTIPRSNSGDRSRRAAQRTAARSVPGLIGGLAEQDRAGMADKALPLSGHRQPVVPPVHSR